MIKTLTPAVKLVNPSSSNDQEKQGRIHELPPLRENRALLLQVLQKLKR